MEDNFDILYNSEIGKAFRNVDKQFAEYFGEPDEYGIMTTPISDYICAYYSGDYSAKQVFSIIIRVLHNYDLICLNEDTNVYSTYNDKTIVCRLNKLKKLINNN